MNLNTQGGGDPQIDNLPPGGPGSYESALGSGLEGGQDLSQCSDQELAQELMRRYPDALEADNEVGDELDDLEMPSSPEPRYSESRYAGAEDPVDEIVRRLAERDAVVDHVINEIEDHLGQLDPQDVRALRQLLKAPDMTPDALRELHAHGLLLTHAKGLAYDRLHAQGAGGHTAAPVTPGAGSPRDGLSVAELNRIRELAPRLQVPVDELKAQYVARKRQTR
jgi:hypothetical protein